MTESAPAPEEQRFRWQSLFQQSTEAVFVLNRRRRLVYVNAAWEGLTGITARDARGGVCRPQPRGRALEWSECVRAALAPSPETLAGQASRVRRLLPAMPDHPGPQWWDIQFMPFAGPSAEQASEAQAPLPDGSSTRATSAARAAIIAVVGKITVLPSAGLFSNPPLPEKIIALRDRLTGQHTLDRLVCQTASMARVMEQARLAASTTLPVLLV